MPGGGALAARFNDRADPEHTAEALAAEERQRRDRDWGHLRQSSCEQDFELSRGGFFEMAGSAAGVVDYNIDSTESTEGHVNRRLRTDGVNQVEKQRKNALPVSNHQIVQIFSRTWSRYEGITGVEHGFSERASRPARSPGNEPNFVRRILFHAGKYRTGSTSCN